MAKTAKIEIAGLAPVARFISEIGNIARSAEPKTAKRIWKALEDLAGTPGDET